MGNKVVVSGRWRYSGNSARAFPPKLQDRYLRRRERFVNVIHLVHLLHDLRAEDLRKFEDIVLCRVPKKKIWGEDHLYNFTMHKTHLFS
jgi:hypothetical protein